MAHFDVFYTRWKSKFHCTIVFKHALLWEILFYRIYLTEWYAIHWFLTVAYLSQLYFNFLILFHICLLLLLVSPFFFDLILFCIWKYKNKSNIDIKTCWEKGKKRNRTFHRCAGMKQRKISLMPEESPEITYIAFLFLFSSFKNLLFMLVGEST
jgi:hypothetical protein